MTRAAILTTNAIAASAAVLLVALCGCAGKASSSTASERQPPRPSKAGLNTSAAQMARARAHGYMQDDGDRDYDDEGHPVSNEDNDDLARQTEYGPLAGEPDRRAIVGLVTTYFAAAESGDGAKTCAMLAGTLAAGLTQNNVQSAASACAATVRPLLVRQHRALAANVPTMQVIAVRTKGEVGLAELGFKRFPRSEVIVAREGGAWKMNTLFYDEMP